EQQGGQNQAFKRFVGDSGHDVSRQKDGHASDECAFKKRFHSAGQNRRQEKPAPVCSANYSMPRCQKQGVSRPGEQKLNSTEGNEGNEGGKELSRRNGCYRKNSLKSRANYGKGFQPDYQRFQFLLRTLLTSNPPSDCIIQVRAQ